MAIKKITGLEIKVGVMAGAALLMLAIIIFTVEKLHFGESGYPIYVSFQFVDAIKPQSDVVIGGGVTIGRVSDIIVEGERINLKVMVDSNVQIPSDAKFQILSKGVMGDKYLNVVAKAGAGDFLKPGARVEGVEPTTIDKAFERFGQVADSIKLMLGDPKFKVNLGEMLRNFGQVAYRMDRILTQNEKSLSSAVTDFSGAAKNIREVSEDLDAVSRGLKNMLSEGNQKNVESSLVKLNQITERLDNQLRLVEQGKGTVGVLLNDAQVAKDLKDLVRDLKKNPWKLMWK